MENRKIVLIALNFFFLCALHAYDYSWPVDYLIVDKTQEMTNSIVESYINENSEFQFYERKHNLNNNEDCYKLALGVIAWPSVSPQTNEALKENGCDPIIPDKVLAGCIYLEDIDSYVYFSILPLEKPERIILRLTGYGIGSDIQQGVRTYKKSVNSYAFNDVEPTKKELKVKESFEKNFMSQIPLEWKYQEPAGLDKLLSKILSFFRKRKNFID